MLREKLFLLFATTLAACAPAYGAAESPRTTMPPPSLPAFAFIFRSSAQLDPPSLAKRNAAARAWALDRGAEGALRNAAPLDAEGVVVSAGSESATLPELAVAAVLLIAAPDLAAAVRLAKSHPGLAYGTEIEVRPVKSVVLPTPAR